MIDYVPVNEKIFVSSHKSTRIGDGDGKFLKTATFPPAKKGAPEI